MEREAENRNSRFASLYSNTIEHFIEQTHIVIGCGSIGGYIIKILGQIGVKKLVLWDFDKIEVVNIGPQGFYQEDVGEFKAMVRSAEFNLLSTDSDCYVYLTRFQKIADHDTEAYWWLCVDSLDAREFIFEEAIENSPHRIIDTRMGGLNYEIYNCLGKTPDKYLESIQHAREHPVQEGCTTRSTPHTAMLAASIGINMALTETPPWKVSGNMMDYNQEVLW